MSAFARIVGVAVLFIVGGSAVWWWRSRSRNRTGKGEAVNLIPDMLKGATSPTQQDIATILTKNCDEYKSNGFWWGLFYFGSVFLSAVFSAFAALVLKLKFFTDHSSDLAAISATSAALLVTLSSVVDFRRNWQACRVAEADVQNLLYDLLSQGTRADPKAILEHLTKINTAYNQAIVGTGQAPPRAAAAENGTIGPPVNEEPAKPEVDIAQQAPPGEQIPAAGAEKVTVVPPVKEGAGQPEVDITQQAPPGEQIPAAGAENVTVVPPVKE